jgi:hypothetical protein
MSMAGSPLATSRAAWHCMIIFAYYDVVGQTFAGQSLNWSKTSLMKPPSPARSLESGNLNQLDEDEALLLEKIADRLVRFGQLVGMTPEEIVSLLDSGVSIHDLVAVIVSRRSGSA